MYFIPIHSAYSEVEVSAFTYATEFFYFQWMELESCGSAINQCFNGREMPRTPEPWSWGSIPQRINEDLLLGAADAIEIRIIRNKRLFLEWIPLFHSPSRTMNNAEQFNLDGKTGFVLDPFWRSRPSGVRQSKDTKWTLPLISRSRHILSLKSLQSPSDTAWNLRWQRRRTGVMARERQLQMNGTVPRHLKYSKLQYGPRSLLW